MSNFPDQLEQIKTLISSPSKSEKPFAYSTLQQLQEQASNDNSLIQPLVDSSESILSSIVADIRFKDADEEIVALALKCLGFMIYHPSIVTAIPKKCIAEVLESLARLITTTKIKAVCNLGVWCISIQQLDSSSLVFHFDLLLRSVVHALDNPAGSLSTTFEAIQAVMKLAAQVGEKMRDTSSIWAPPIYRRLLSADKRERDMSQRCLLKIKCLIVSPLQALSKAIAHEMKHGLLSAMKEMLKQGKKVQALQAWGWFIRILGYHSLKSRHLVNELLKVPEQTFSDSDPQIQVATLVAWEGLIDALVAFPTKDCDTVTVSLLCLEQDKAKSIVASELNQRNIRTGECSKGVKLIMTPIIGIMASQTDLSVQSSCLNTWCYLLHKLDDSVNDPSILGIVVEPLLKAVLNIKLDDRNIWIWSTCMSLLHDFIKSKSLDNGSLTNVSCESLPRTTNNVRPLLGESALKTYSVRWLPWNCSHMDFLVRMIQMTLRKTAMVTLSSENSKLISDVILRMFRFFLKGVQIDLANSLASYDSVMQCISAIFGLVRTLCEAALSVDGQCNGFQVCCLQSLEAVIQELDPSILGSPLYKVPLDVEYVFQGEASYNMGKVSMSFMDMVPPVTYLTVLYYYVVIQVSIKAVSHESVLRDADSYLNKLLSSYELLDILRAIAASLHVLVEESSLRVWVNVAQCLRDHLYSAKDLLPLKIQPNSFGSHTLCNFLVYPLVVCSSPKAMGTTKNCNSGASPILLENCTLEKVTEVWVSLYSSVNCTIMQELPRKNWFTEDLCLSLNDFLHQQSNLSEGFTMFDAKSREHQLLSLSGDIGKCILENLNIEKVTPEAIKCSYTGSSGFNNCLDFTARLMNLLSTKIEEAPKIVVISRLLPPLKHIAGHLQWKEDITSFVEVLGDPLLCWMSDAALGSDSINNQLSLLWTEIIRSLQRSWPSVEFNSSFLKLIAPLLEKTLGHPSPSISEPTINFWNSAYGDQLHVEAPPYLLHVLDKLSRVGKVKIRSRKAPMLEKDTNDPPRHKVTATLRMCSKRVELVKDAKVTSAKTSELPPCPKRKRSELTEHQREVRRAQQGKGRDCSGHGPGIRTYTSVDFSQGNEDSQDSQDIIRDSELILDLLKRQG